jgi:hypothetical protein
LVNFAHHLIWPLPHIYCSGQPEKQQALVKNENHLDSQRHSPVENLEIFTHCAQALPHNDVLIRIGIAARTKRVIVNDSRTGQSRAAEFIYYTLTLLFNGLIQNGITGKVRSYFSACLSSA